MLIAAPAETDPGETRVAATPETVKKFVGLGAEVAVEHGAGAKAGFPDAEYQSAGARLVDAEEALGADVVLEGSPAERERNSRVSNPARSSSRRWTPMAIARRSRRWPRLGSQPSPWSSCRA